MVTQQRRRDGANNDICGGGGGGGGHSSKQADAARNDSSKDHGSSDSPFPEDGKVAGGYEMLLPTTSKESARAGAERTKHESRHHRIAVPATAQTTMSTASKSDENAQSRGGAASRALAASDGAPSSKASPSRRHSARLLDGAATSAQLPPSTLSEHARAQSSGNSMLSAQRCKRDDVARSQWQRPKPDAASRKSESTTTMEPAVVASTAATAPRQRARNDALPEQLNTIASASSCAIKSTRTPTQNLSSAASLSSTFSPSSQLSVVGKHFKRTEYKQRSLDSKINIIENKLHHLAKQVERIIKQTSLSSRRSGKFLSTETSLISAHSTSKNVYKANIKGTVSSKLTQSNSHSSRHSLLAIAVNNKMVDQAVIDKLEAGFAKLQASTPEQCHSLLKKYLTREVLDKLKTKKTAMGATLLDVAQSGFENLDSGVGIYAPDAESYTLFADLFNPIIEDYHGGFKPSDKHPASDFGDINTLVNVDPDNQFVISTRVRCGRSLQGYPFNPCLTEAQYREMEQKVSTTLKEVGGDLAGTYYPLTGMTKETQQQLIDDHFLFKEGDRFLQAANACRYWPTGRGIYHNSEKSFLVWVNEEDHLRIISMQKGGDLKTIYDRLIRGAKAIEAKVPFSRDERLGFLTFCPTNLGTTIRASVHIKLPKLAADRKKLEEVASRYNLQVRGTSGEHTESVGGIYDISNKRRLGLTEYQAVREMQDGILELIKIEKSL